MTRTLVSVSWRLIAASTLAVIGGAAGCGGRASAICSADPSPSASAVLIDVSLDANAGGTPFAIGAKMMSNTGVEYTASTLRFYLSHVELLDGNGVASPAVLADAGGTPLRYGVTLVDYRKPDSQVLHLLVPPGSYESLSLSVGVPRDRRAESRERLGAERSARRRLGHVLGMGLRLRILQDRGSRDHAGRQQGVLVSPRR